ncbi:protein IQ-DOMAIN 13-like [Curcuma longa]|uniref:protein IQ-DOMAIN 13-like n=1 Tax=Curcuma longa TaxID=136217 RepID=UPI003D9ED762
MGKTSGWFTLIKRAFTSSSKDKLVQTSTPIQYSQDKHTREKKKWGFSKSNHDDNGSFIHMHRQQSIIERILEDVQNEQHQQHRVQQVLPKKAQQSKSPARKPRTVPNYAHISAIKIQAAYRGYRARRSYRALKGLMRLQRAIRNQRVKQQTTNTLRCMRMLVRLQLQIRDRRLKMMENRSLQLHQALPRNDESETNFGGWSVARQTEAEGFEGEWEDSVLTKEELEARIRRKVEATIRRERALAYAYTHQLLKMTPKSAKAMLTDLRTRRAPWWWSSLESQLATNNVEVVPPPSQNSSRLHTPQAATTVHSKATTSRPRSSHYVRLKPEYADDASLVSCPPLAVPNYMTTTVSAQAKARSHRAFGTVPGSEKKRFSFGLGQTIGSLFASKEANRRGCESSCSGLRSVRIQERHRSTQSVSSMSMDSIMSLPTGRVGGRRNYK